MRLDELTLPSDIKSAGRILKAAGWGEDSTGLNSLVYYRDDKNYILKLFKSRDNAYWAFLELVLANPNKHFPKIIGKPKKVTDAYYAVRMERLEPIKTPAHLKIYLEVQSGERDSEDLFGFMEERYQRAISYLQENPEMKVALDLIAEKLLPIYEEDLHDGNIMERPDGTYVIIDPVIPRF